MSVCYILGAMECDPNVINRQEGDCVIAADGGYRYAEKINPDLIIGDFDSLGYVPKADKCEVFPVQKDDTDMMLAIKKGLQLGYKEFVLLGGIGGRLDHTIANIQSLAYLLDHGARGKMLSSHEEIYMIENDKITFGADSNGLCSVFAFGKEANGVTIQGLQYEVTDVILNNSFPLGVSNHFVGKQALVSVTDGRLLIIMSKENE